MANSKLSAKKVKQIDNPLEKLLSGAMDDILGSGRSEKRQTSDAKELKPGEEVSFAKPQEKDSEIKEEKVYVEPGISYVKEIVHAEERFVTRENQEIEAQLKEIMAEIKKLTDSSKELQMQFKTVAVEQYVTKPGKYHKAFFSWLLSVIKAARMKVEDSGAWLAAMHSKKKSKGYWEMAKKSGTSFSLSNERNVATQVG